MSNHPQPFRLEALRISSVMEKSMDAHTPGRSLLGGSSSQFTQFNQASGDGGGVSAFHLLSCCYGGGGGTQTVHTDDPYQHSDWTYQFGQLEHEGLEIHRVRVRHY